MKDQNITKRNQLANNALNNGGVRNNNLGAKNNDECYTDPKDIIPEMQYWAELRKFKDKNIICPCDWDADEKIISITITYTEDKIELTTNNINKIKKFIPVDLWNDDTQLNNINKSVTAKDIEELLKEKHMCGFLQVFTQNAKAWGIKSITASGYNPETDRGTKFQDVDYSKYDICVTNPPFSLFSEFMKSVVGKIDFIVLAPFMNRVTPNVGGYLMTKQAYIGHSGSLAGGSVHINFKNPTIANKLHSKKVNCDWITSFSEAQDERNENLTGTGISYELYESEYVEMPLMTMSDGTHPIRVPGVKYPDDYDGWMFASIQILTSISHTKYEWYGTQCNKYLNDMFEEGTSPFAHKAHNYMYKVNVDDDTNGFGGVVFRKKSS